MAGNHVPIVPHRIELNTPADHHNRCIEDSFAYCHGSQIVRGIRDALILFRGMMGRPRVYFELIVKESYQAFLAAERIIERISGIITE